MADGTKLINSSVKTLSLTNALDTGKYVLVMAAIVWLLDSGSKELGYNWQWYQIPQYLWRNTPDGLTWGLLMQGLGVTFKITGISLCLMLIFGLFTALMRMSNSWAARGAARAYMEIIRNSPLLIQIYFIYFVIAPVLDMGAFWAAVISLSLFEGAYASEIFRAGITSIDRGQFEAAQSLGMNDFAMYRHIILPQAIRRVLPPLTGQIVSLVKDSALVSTIAIFDLTMQGQSIIATTFLTFEVWFTVAAIYILINLALTSVSRLMEKKSYNGHQNEA